MLLVCAATIPMERNLILYHQNRVAKLVGLAKVYIVACQDIDITSFTSHVNPPSLVFFPLDVLVPNLQGQSFDTPGKT
jgi:hypothetical protein